MIAPSSFVPVPWLRGPHRQTLFASKLRRTPRLAVRQERLELPDGDFLDLAWLPENGAAAQAPLVVVLHGLTGSIKSNYARGLLRQVARRGWRGLLMHFRGASGQPNRLARSYHSGDTGDFTWLLQQLRARHPQAPLLAVGYSLGGNVLLKYLGEQETAALPAAAVAVSVPFDLAACAAAINRGASRA
ncbi:MAG: alpha/beta fold hydrolase, partial [Salinisphaera sp.]|nr:alpha/beta fold hydrolase [Salinisphaera sp.]